MIVNGEILYRAQPIEGMLRHKMQAEEGGASYGLSEAGYDIRIKQNVHFCRRHDGVRVVEVYEQGCHPHTIVANPGKFALASAMDKFNMPTDLLGVVHDKSTWARRGLSVFNTTIKPGWIGFLTLELVYHGEEDLFIPAGSGIAEVIFHTTTGSRAYEGVYQNQEDRPVPAR